MYINIYIFVCVCTCVVCVCVCACICVRVSVRTGRQTASMHESVCEHACERVYVSGGYARECVS